MSGVNLSSVIFMTELSSDAEEDSSFANIYMEELLFANNKEQQDRNTTYLLRKRLL